jgi:hypothetical protein
MEDRWAVIAGEGWGEGPRQNAVGSINTSPPIKRGRYLAGCTHPRITPPPLKVA